MNGPTLCCPRPQRVNLTTSTRTNHLLWVDPLGRRFNRAHHPHTSEVSDFSESAASARHGPLGDRSLHRSTVGLGRTARSMVPTSEHNRTRRLIGLHPRLPPQTPTHPCTSEVGRAYSFYPSQSSPINPQLQIQHLILLQNKNCAS